MVTLLFDLQKTFNQKWKYNIMKQLYNQRRLACICVQLIQEQDFPYSGRAVAVSTTKTRK